MQSSFGGRQSGIAIAIAIANAIIFAVIVAVPIAAAVASTALLLLAEDIVGCVCEVWI
jgi:hypothetical protein